ncbi:ion transporter [Micromonospora sp. B11E3]|uniref:ion transporter n=1 Tax=Micromonospora sp. B11E3 TaxID=3153562 RepID=UPI00325CF0AA
MPAVLRRPAAAPSEPPGVADRFARVVRSRPFEIAIVVIMANGVVLGLETYPHLGEVRPVLRWLEWSFRVVFVAEIAARVLAYGRRPQDFFRHGWNVFDFLSASSPLRGRR